MKKEILSLYCALALSLSACAPAAPVETAEETTLAAVTAPAETEPSFDRKPHIPETIL